MRIFFLGALFYGILLASVSAETGVLTIDWSKLNQNKAEVSARKTPYPQKLRKGIASVTLPVLLPASQAYNKNMIVVADKNFYTITLPLKGANIIVTGDRAYQQTLDSASKLVPASLPAAQFTRAEGMMLTDFNRFGANYSLTLECDQPDQDSRCLQESFLKNLYQELVMVGGHP